MIEQAYSPSYDGYCDIKRGFKLPNGDYIEKNEKKHKRVRKRAKAPRRNLNERWMFYV